MRYFEVDVFTDRLFSGNSAGVCLLDTWLEDATLQSIATENNLSETAFLVKQDNYYDLRWFTPDIEVDLCGHATMASAFVLFEFVEKTAEKLHFMTKSGELIVKQGAEGMLWMDFPARPGKPVPNYPALVQSFGRDDFTTYWSNDLLVVFASEDQVLNLQPDFDKLRSVKTEAAMPSDDFGVIVTAPGKTCDFVSRFFAPTVGVNEDPVTGRAHCVLTPYWAERLGKTSMTARQVSERGGQLWCEAAGQRVHIGGRAVLFMSGQIHL